MQAIISKNHAQFVDIDNYKGNSKLIYKEQHHILFSLFTTVQFSSEIYRGIIKHQQILKYQGENQNLESKGLDYKKKLSSVNKHMVVMEPSHLGR